jgi:hypothetical protein
MHLPINVKSPNNIRKWHMGLNSAFKGLNMNFPYFPDIIKIISTTITAYITRLNIKELCNLFTRHVRLSRVILRINSNWSL